MRKNISGKLAVNLFLFLLVVALAACGSTSSSLPPSSSGTGTDTGTGTVVVGTVSVTATPTSVTVGGSSSIEATVKDSNGVNVPDGTVVSFSLSDSSLGAINPQSTTYNGVATATFTAGTGAGTVIITATAGSVSSTVSVSITTGADAGSIEFSSASPQVIGIKGTGQTETSTITFLVKDVNGNPVVDGTLVTFTMSKLNGDEYVDPDTKTVNGEAVTILHSGYVAGPVMIKASVDVNGTTLSSSSAPISIGGGVPTDRSFTLVTDVFNLPGLAYVNKKANISAYIADRFGNYNVLEGTSISFYTEAGAIDRNVNVDSTGAGSVIFRTQNPIPADVVPDADEAALQTYVNTTWGITANNPRDGWVTILATVMGEESFEDANANGIYDDGENFTDIGEPFIDKNDNGVRDDGTGSAPFEEYIDVNGDGQYTGPNGCWDGPDANPAYVCAGRKMGRMIFQWTKIMVTGEPVYIKVNPSTFTIADGGSQTFKVLVADVNLNRPSLGTTISVSSDGGTLTTNNLSSPVADGLTKSPVMFDFTLSDATVGDTDPPENVRAVVEVVLEDVTYSVVIPGTIN